MIFDYKEGMKKRETLSQQQQELLDEFVNKFKTSFQSWYKEVDKSKVKWSISLFLIDCGYSCTQQDCLLQFLIPTGVEENGLNMLKVIVKQYSANFNIGEHSLELSLADLRGDQLWLTQTKLRH